MSHWLLALGAGALFGIALGGNCPIYCKAGDVIVPVVYVDTQPGTANALSSLKVFGEANHILSYWSMTRMFGT